MLTAPRNTRSGRAKLFFFSFDFDIFDIIAPLAPRASAGGGLERK
jgi:hypothetical protein